MESTITIQLGAVNFEVEVGGGLMRRHADQHFKLLPRFAAEGILDVQAGIITNNPGIPVVPEIPEEFMQLDGTHIEEAAMAPVETRKPTTPSIRTSGYICRSPIKLNNYICSSK